MASHGAPVAHARVGRAACALELDFLRAVRRGDFAEQNRPAIAELPGPMAELVAAVACRIGLHAGQDAVAAERLDRAAHLLAVAAEAGRPA